MQQVYIYRRNANDHDCHIWMSFHLRMSSASTGNVIKCHFTCHLPSVMNLRRKWRDGVRGGGEQGRETGERERTIKMGQRMDLIEESNR